MRGRFNINTVHHDPNYHNLQILSPLASLLLVVMATAARRCRLVHLDNTVDLSDEPEAGEEPDRACTQFIQTHVTNSQLLVPL